ncbi:MAG: hypothetical protein M1331_01020 [Candidatus Marsarchaeota archaeon]|nr:hypothetical protein [Candidatus Marsarchaeota archaeon]MCL5105965.1 hypothetical protein [Candidatus Marsarchaeota archaeon]
MRLKSGSNKKIYTALIAVLAILFFAGTSFSQSLPNPNPFPANTGPAYNSCSMFGGSGYTNYNNWISINVTVLIIGLLITAIVFMFSRVLPAKESQKFSQAAKVEIMQIIIGAAILVILLALTNTVCSITSSIASSLSTSASPMPSGNPFQFSEYYVGNLANNVGIKLLQQIYTEAIAFNIDSMIFKNIGALLFSVLSSATGLAGSLEKILAGLSSGISFSNGISIGVSFTSGYNLGVSYGIVSEMLLTFFAPFVITGIGMLYILWLLLPVIQAVAFTVVLPVALAMRVIAFSGFGAGAGSAKSVGLKNAANSMLAIAIAFYLVLPLTIVFNAWAINWIFSSGNPSYTYIHSTYLLSSIQETSLFSSSPTPSSWFGLNVPSLFNIYTSALTGNMIWASIDPNILMQDLLTMVNEISQFEFTVIFMIAIDFAITLGFAMGLARALNSNLA